MLSYKVYHALHPGNSAHGGSAIIVKENLQHYEEIKYEQPEIQAVAIRLECKHYPLTIAAVYCPPRYSISKEEYVSFLRQHGQRFIVGGDFNAKHTYWGSRLNNTKGGQLLKAIQELHCESVSTGKPTYWPTDPDRIPDLIDFFICKNIPSNEINIEDFNYMNSDHSPILLTLCRRMLRYEKRPILVNKYTDWDSLRLDLDNRIELKVPLKTTEQLDSEVRQFIVD
ncbi:unnamed protein product [Danaus chrysippus]|uniref:(African queen) hypothetical protein n=1 Tax=Danaus chrysippus TaxID=151541 RepID=A0A8J2QC35_9NEOP|nr:unnamed protein product [Danaus chrysippus]